MSGAADYDEFQKAMAEMGLDQGELMAMFRYMDVDCSGSLSFNEFLEVVRGPMNKERVALVLRAFKVSRQRR